MIIDPQQVQSTAVYHALISLITPRPIAWVSTVSTDGVRNLAPFSFFTGITSNPATVVFCGGHKANGQPKDSIRNAMETGEFVINVVPSALAEPMVASSAELPFDVDEFERTGLSAVPSERVAAPGVAGSPARLECTLHQLVEIKDDEGTITSRMVIGRVRHIWIDDAVLDARQRVDPRKLDPIARLGGAYYSRTQDVFELARPKTK